MLEESRNALHARFVEIFADREFHGAVGGGTLELELAELARFLTTHLPASYVQFMGHHGPVFCPGVLRLTLACGLEHPDLRQFLAPQQVLKTSRDFWCRHLPVDLFVFAMDCMGNGFCFRQSKVPVDDAAVFFFSQQREKLLDLGETFDGLLRWYVEQRRAVPVS